MTDQAAAGAPSRAAGNQFALFGSRRFTPLFIVQFLGAFNDQTFKNAFVALLTYRLADSMALTEGQVDLFVQMSAGLYILPFALCAATAGQIADGMDKARMMRRVKFAEIVLMGIAAAAYLTQALPVLLILMFLMGAQSAFFAPIKYGVLPQYMKRDEMPAANGLIQGATFLAILLGQIFGAKLVLTDSGVLAVSVAVVVIAVIGWIASFWAPSAPPMGPKPKVNWIMPLAMVQIIRECRDSKPAMFAMLALGWFWFAGATFLSLIFQVAKFSLLASEDVALILLTSFSVGVALGAVFYSVIVKGEVTLKTAPWGAAGMAVGALLFYFAVGAYGAGLEGRTELMGVSEFLGRAESWPVLGALVFMAMCAGLYVTPLNVEYQVKAPEGRKGQFVACSNVIDSLCMVFSAAVTAALIGALGVPREGVFALAGLTGFIAAWIVWRKARAEG
ncbi:MAG: MFS transporter [Pikeienuella sp.]|uniref:MFS transporter n=1 Tax=Pikeienuella sp. TaxID=2831957 RepID=UPI00391D2E07